MRQSERDLKESKRLLRGGLRYYCPQPGYYKSENKAQLVTSCLKVKKERTSFIKSKFLFPQIWLNLPSGAAASKGTDEVWRSLLVAETTSPGGDK